MNRLVAIVGPTGIGKSRLALRLAQDFSGEIIGADSRQVYRYMDIGTAKPSREEQSLVPHHLIDIVNPDQDFSLAQYQKLAYESIAGIQQHQKLPLLVGGSGLYIRAVLEGWQIPHVLPNTELRQSLAERAAKEGVETLYQELVRIDPASAQRIDPHNTRRVIRALEVCQSTGVPFSRLQQKTTPPFETLIISLTTDRAELYRRVDARVDRMIEQGLVEEVKRLVSMGYGFDLPAMSGIGYKQIGQYLNGALTPKTATQQIKFETHRFVRQQYNWFRLGDKRIQWFDIQSEAEAEISASVKKFISGK